MGRTQTPQPPANKTSSGWQKMAAGGTWVFATAGGAALAFASEPLSDLAVGPPLDDPVAFDVFALLLLCPLKFGAAKGT